MSNRRQEEEECYKYFLTTCGLIGFIAFFLATFFSFIIAEDTSEYYEHALIFGFVMLFITSLFFCCIMRESKYAFRTSIQPSYCLPLDALQPNQPEHFGESDLPARPQHEPYWSDKTRHDLKYVRRVLGLPTGDLDETIESESEINIETIPLRNISKSSLDAENKEPIYESIPETSTACQDKDSKCVEAADIQSHSTKAGPSKVAGESSDIIESRSDASPLEGISALSLSDSSESTTASGQKQTENLLEALSKLSLGDSKKQVAEMAKHDPSSITVEGKSDVHPQQAETFKEETEIKSSELE